MVLLSGGQGEGPTDKYPIYARSGWRIPTEHVEIDRKLTLPIIRIHSEQLQIWHPNASLRSTSDYPYNCVGLVFASRRAWIEPEYVHRILIEDDYRRIAFNETVPGDVVVYTDAGVVSHVGLILIVDTIGAVRNVKVVSKWGQDAEFIHFVEDVPPQLGSPTEYWTDRIR